MITKSKLIEAEIYWKKLLGSTSHTEKIGNLKQLISLLDTEDYFEETADYLGTTTLMLRHLTILSTVDDKKLSFLLGLADGNLDLCYLFYLFPDKELESFIKTFKKISSVEKLVLLASNKLDYLHSLAQNENPWLEEFSSIDKDVWAALADDSEKWIDFKDVNTKKIRRFSTHTKQSSASWQWLYDICQQKYNQGLIKEVNHKGIKVTHHIEIINALASF